MTIKARLRKLEQALQPDDGADLKAMTDSQLERVIGLGPNPTDAQLEALIRSTPEESPDGNR